MELSPPTISDDRSDNATEVNESSEAVIKNCRSIVTEEKLASEVQNENCLE